MLGAWILFQQNLKMGGGPVLPAHPPLFTAVSDYAYAIVDTFNINDFIYSSGSPRVAQEDTRAYFVGDTKKFQARNVDKNGTPWALSSATLYLEDPSGVVAPYAATSTDSVTWTYQSLGIDLSTPGLWHRFWKVNDGTSDDRMGHYSFFVMDAK